MNLIHITEKFIKHLNSLERMLDYSSLIKDKFDDNEDMGVLEAISFVIDLKSNEYNKDLDPEETIKRKEVLEKLMENKNLKFIYNNIIITEGEDGEIGIKMNNAMLHKYFTEELENRDNILTDVTQLKNSIIISLVTSMELLIADLFKDFILNVDGSDFLEKKSVSYQELLKIGNIEEAKDFLLDQYIEELLRGSFLSWIKEIEGKIKIKISNIPIIKEKNDIEFINETFQRRHLLIHNDAVVNDLYLSKTDRVTQDGIEKGDKLKPTSDYIMESISLFRRVGVILIYKYAEKKHRSNFDGFFSRFNSILLSMLDKKCDSIIYSYTNAFERKDLEHSTFLMSKVNYFLFYKTNDDFEVIKEEVEKFSVGTLSSEFKMAKHILLDNIPDAFSEFKLYIGNHTDDEFFHTIDWPLIKLVKDEPVFKEYIRQKMKELLETEGSNEDEETA